MIDWQEEYGINKLVGRMTRNQFLSWVLDAIPNVPKCEARVLPVISTTDDEYGEWAGVIARGTHEIFVREDQYKRLSDLLAVLAHEAHHAAMCDICHALKAGGIINDAVYNLLTERASAVTEEIVRVIVARYSEIKAEHKETL